MGDVRNIFPENKNVGIIQMKYLTQGNIRKLLDYYGFTDWEQARRVKNYSKRMREKGVLRKLKDEYNQEQFNIQVGGVIAGTTTIFPINRLKELITKLPTDRDFLITMGDMTYALNENTRERLSDPDFFTQEIEEPGSDKEFLAEIKVAKEFEVSLLEQEGMVLPQGAFFPYTHSLNDIDLSSLQIYREDNYNYENINNTNCFLHALYNAGVNSTTLDQVRMSIKSRLIPQREIKKIAEKYKLYITVNSVADSKHLLKYGQRTDNPIKLGLVENHYFHIHQMPVNKWALENYEDIKHLPEWTKYYRKGKKGERYIDSYNLVKWLVQSKYVSKLTSDILAKTVYNDKSVVINSLEFTDENFRESTMKESGREDDYINVFFDFETDTSGDIHVPYLCRCSNIDKQYLGEDCGLLMMNDLVRKYNGAPMRMIAHNAGYDIRFIFKYLRNISLIERGRSLLRGRATFFKTKIIIQDSCAFIPMALKKFGKTFNLDCEKEVMIYNLYTTENIKKRLVEIPEDAPEAFYENARKWGCMKDGGLIDIIKYSDVYCKMDCEVLQKGYELFRKWMLEITHLDINEYCSLASIANDTMYECYEDVYQVSGVVRQFIQQAMVGGRTMCADNKKITVINDVDDFDATSLYPSAMARLGGYLKGKPKVLTDLTYSFLEKQTGYFVEIEILSVGIRRKFSLLSRINEKGTRIFNNDMVGQIITVDKFTLEDLITYQKVKFKILRGYYYDQGRNLTLAPVISRLFNERVIKKNEGNPIETVYKLLMNASYGKTLLKPFEIEKKYIPNKDVNKFVSRHYAHVREISRINDEITSVEVYKTVVEHFNNAICGVEVLSMSKRIMNEVICTAEDNGLNVYYQDTDSLHIDTKSIPVLRELFKNKYGRELIGKGMGQFHTDFESDILNKDHNIKAIKSIFLGKKSYLDVLTDDSGKIDYHIRMKGCSNDSIIYWCKQNNATPVELYERLFKGDTIELDQMCGGTAFKVDYGDDMTIWSKETFTRKVKF